MASTIKVDNVQNQPGTNVVNKCGTTVNIGAASDNIRSAGNNLQASDGGNLISQSGTTITLGASGDTITLASGASQTGFGRTGTVDWQTGSIKTATFTAATGEGYFCNTTGGAFEVDLPAGAAGSIVSIQDYNNTFDTYNLTVDPNGSEKINGGSAGDPVLLTVEGQGVTFVYIDSTVGWRSVQDNTFSTVGASFIGATGGNAIVTCGDYKTHIFTAPGTFCVASLSSNAANNNVDWLVVAGGGGSAQYYGGGAGAGGYRESPGAATGCYTVSPLGAAPAAAITVTVQGYPIAVGGGGAGSTGNPSSPVAGLPGSVSTFSTYTSTGGGRGGGGNPSLYQAETGGSGGGGGGGPPGMSGQAGNTPPVSPPQGNAGASKQPGQGGGGGGATAAAPNETGGAGAGTAITTSTCYGTPGPNGSLRYYAGGGNGQGDSTPVPGGGGPGTGDTNTGGGGAGDSAAGGSGIVMIRYKWQ